LGFWEAVDDFKFEKTFNISENKEIKEDQTRIWYIEHIDKWLTTD